MDAKGRVIEQLDDLRRRKVLGWAAYGVARRLLDRAHEANGAVLLSYAEMCELCETTSDQTVRGHLDDLSGAGVLTYRRNSRVAVFFHGWEVAPNLRESRQNSADRGELARLDDVADPDCSRQNSANCGENSASDDGDLTQSRQNSAIRAKITANRGNLAHPIAGFSKQAGLDPGSKACLPAAGGAGGDGQSPAPPGQARLRKPRASPSGSPPSGSPPSGSPPSDDPERARCVALLADPDGLALDADTARRWVGSAPFVLVRAHLFRLLEERKQRPNLGAAVLETRLRRRWSATVPEWARSDPLWNRYAVGEELADAAPDPDTEEGRRAKYLPAEYGDIIIG